MTFYQEAPVPGTPFPVQQNVRQASWWSAPGMKIGLSALAVAMVALLAMGFIPTGYVIEKPGPVINTLGTIPMQEEGEAAKDVPLITIDGEENYPTGGTLSLTTVSIAGSRERTATWLELAQAWFDPSQAVVPVDEIFPVGQTTEQRNEQNQVMMQNSQTTAAVAALRELDYDIPGTPAVVEVVADSPADGKLKAGDLLRSVGGTPITEATDVSKIVRASEGKPVTFGVERDGKPVQVDVTPRQQEVDGETHWVVGISVGAVFDKLPVDITFEVGNVGGPSAGMMFSLGIIDKLTPGELNGGQNVAGTGTIDAQGNVGAIGGIRQKLYGASNAGADYFIAPLKNCDEVVGHIPDGLTVVTTETLAQSVDILETIASGSGIDKLPTCSADSAK